MNSVTWGNPDRLWERPKTPGRKTGTIAVLDTWGQNLQLHPHLHCIVSKGGVSKAGFWKKGKRKDDFLFPVKAMSLKYWGLFVPKLPRALPQLSQSLYDGLFKKEWVVYARPYTDPSFRFSEQQLEKRQVTAVTTAIGGQEPDTRRNLRCSGKIAASHLP